MPSIKTTTDISWEPDPEKDDRLFVSYQHTDKVIVNDIINRLERKGFLLWWDKQIYAGEEWEEDIKDALNRSSSFLGFISNGISESKWSIFEIREAIKNRKRKREQGGNYTIVLVFVEKVPMSSFPKDIREEVEKSQYISFWEHNGITEDFLRSLLGAKWDPSVIKEDRRKEIKNFAKGHKLGTLADFFSGVDVEPRSYHRLSLHANKATKDDVHPAFYRLEPNDLTSRETVYPVILDNQWLPPEFYDKNNPKYSSVDKQIRDAFAEKGLSSEDNEKLKSEIDNMQRREFIRALLHNWQLVVNRAAIFNTTALRKWYTPGSDDYTAFGQLIGDDSIVIYLYSENYPTEEPPFDYDKENYEAWENFCFDRPDKKEVSCVRFDWEKQGNDSEKARLLSGRVEKFFLTLAHDKNLKNELMRTFGITDEEQDSFELCLRTIQQDIINHSLTDGTAYKREHFYDTFLIEKKKLPSGRISQVNDGILRKNKKDGEYCRFVPVMKQLMDHIYIVNLPDALGIQPYFPPDSGLNPFLLDQHQREMRMLTVNQLIYAVVDFDDSLKQDSGSILDHKMPWPVNGEKLTLAQTAKLRQSSEWRAYLVALTDGKHRNRLNEVDFYNIHTIWEKYLALMNLAKEEFKELDWQDSDGAVSIIYRFESVTIITVYSKDGRKMKAPPDGKKDSVSDSQKRKVRLTIDYVCSDVLKYGLTNPFQSEIRLFEGLTAGEETVMNRTGNIDENGRAEFKQEKTTLYNALKKRLIELGFENIDDLSVKKEEGNNTHE